MLRLIALALTALTASILVASGCGASREAGSFDVWVVGSRGYVFVSHDNGAHWNQARGESPDELMDIAFADSEHGWAVGDVVLATSDGGRNWSSQGFPAGAPNAIDSSDVEHAWAVGASGSPMINDRPLVMDIKGRANYWIEESLGALAFAPWWGRDVAFGDGMHGWIVSDSRKVFVATNDGGASWTQQSADMGRGLRGVAAVDATHAWVVGVDANGGPLVEATVDGSTWGVQPTVGTKPLTAVAFADRSHGWAVGESPGVVLATSDGGASWREQRVPNQTAQGFVAVAAADSQNAWAVSGRSVFRTSDGGAEWTLAGEFPTTLRSVAAVVSGTD